MDCSVGSTEMMTNIMHLCVTVMTTCNAIIRTSLDDLIVLNFSVGSTFLCEA